MTNGIMQARHHITNRPILERNHAGVIILFAAGRVIPPRLVESNCCKMQQKSVADWAAGLFPSLYVLKTSLHPDYLHGGTGSAVL